MKTFLNRLYITMAAIPILLWATIYALATEVPKILVRAWRDETNSMRDSW